MIAQMIAQKWFDECVGMLHWKKPYISGLVLSIRDKLLDSSDWSNFGISSFKFPVIKCATKYDYAN